MLRDVVAAVDVLGVVHEHMSAVRADAGDVAENARDLGQALDDAGDHEAAQRHLRAALAHAKSTGDESDIAHSEVLLALSLANVGALEKAMSLATSARRRFEELGDNEGARIANDLAAGLQLARGGDPDAASARFTGAPPEMQNFDVYLSDQLCRAEILLKQGSPEAASDLVEIATDRAREAGREDGLAVLEMFLSTAYLAQDRFADAERTALAARQGFVNVGRLAEARTCELSLGKVYLATGRYGLADISRYLASVYLRTGRFEEAHAMLLAARDAYVSGGLEGKAVECEVALGDTHRLRGQARYAEQTLRSARQRAECAGLKHALARVDWALGALLLEQRRYPEAHRAICLSGRAHAEMGNRRQAAACGELLATLYYTFGYVDQARSVMADAQRAYSHREYPRRNRGRVMTVGSSRY